MSPKAKNEEGVDIIGGRVFHDPPMSRPSQACCGMPELGGIVSGADGGLNRRDSRRLVEKTRLGAGQCRSGQDKPIELSTSTLTDNPLVPDPSF